MIHTYPDPTAAAPIWTPAEYAPRSNAGTAIRNVNPGDVQALSNVAVPVRSTGSGAQSVPTSASTLYRPPPETGGVYPSYASGQTVSSAVPYPPEPSNPPNPSNTIFRHLINPDVQIPYGTEERGLTDNPLTRIRRVHGPKNQGWKKP